jgi:cholinesterase
MMNYTRGAWAVFAKDPANGLDNYQGGWPAYNPTESTLVRLGDSGSVGMDLAPPAMYDAPCGMAFAVNSSSVNQTVTGAATSSTEKTSMGNVIPVWKGSLTIFAATTTTLKLLL